MPVELNVNGKQRSVNTEPDTPLLYALRNDLGLAGAKHGCGLEQCGACLVLVDGEPTYSCTRVVSDLYGCAITTVEAADDPYLGALRSAFLAHNAAQCGFCTAGILMRARALLERNPQPGRADICAALDPHLCRCGSHPRVIRAVQDAAKTLADQQ